jgi:hypothetical protein
MKRDVGAGGSVACDGVGKGPLGHAAGRTAARGSLADLEPDYATERNARSRNDVVLNIDERFEAPELRQVDT